VTRGQFSSTRPPEGIMGG